MSYFFCDFDGTLADMKTMFDFEHHWLAREARRDSGGQRAEERASRARALADLQTWPRATANLEFYRGFAGRRVDEVAAAIAGWSAALDPWSHFIGETVERMYRLRMDGIEPVIVSGSAMQLIRPFARALGVREVLASRLGERAGAYTGELLHPPIIGEEKRRLVLAFLAERQTEARCCFAVGDHLSDAPMLEAVGAAYVVSGDEALAGLAHTRGWTVLSGERGR